MMTVRNFPLVGTVFLRLVPFSNAAIFLYIWKGLKLWHFYSYFLYICKGLKMVPTGGKPKFFSLSIFSHIQPWYVFSTFCRIKKKLHPETKYYREKMITRFKKKFTKKMVRWCTLRRIDSPSADWKFDFWPISILSQGTSLRCYMMFYG